MMTSTSCACQILGSDEECSYSAALRTVKVPDCEQEYHFDIKVGLRAEHRKELEEILEGQFANAIVTEYFSNTPRKRVE